MLVRCQLVGTHQRKNPRDAQTPRRGHLPWLQNIGFPSNWWHEALSECGRNSCNIQNDFSFWVSHKVRSQNDTHTLEIISLVHIYDPGSFYQSLFHWHPVWQHICEWCADVLLLDTFIASCDQSSWIECIFRILETSFALITRKEWSKL